MEGATDYTDYNELSKDEMIDAVHVCKLNVSHSSITVTSFELVSMYFVKNQCQTYRICAKDDGYMEKIRKEIYNSISK